MGRTQRRTQQLRTQADTDDRFAGGHALRDQGTFGGGVEMRADRPTSMPATS